MAKKVQVVVDVASSSVEIASDRTLTLTQQVRELRKALQTVPEGTAEWTLIQQKYNETKDSLDRVNVKSKELFGTMSALPGPIGDVAGKLDGTIGVLKTFSNIKLTDIQSQFVELLKDIKGIATGFLEVTGITKVYTVINNALASSFVAIGIAEETAAVGARAFAAALTTTGVGLLVVGLGYLVSKLMEVGKEADVTADHVARLNNELANTERHTKQTYEVQIAYLKSVGATEGAIFNQRQHQRQQDLDQARKDYKTFNGQMEAAMILGEGKITKGYTDALKSRNEAAAKIDKIKTEMTVASYEEEARLRDKDLKDQQDAAAKAEKIRAKTTAEIQKEIDARNQAIDQIIKAQGEAYKATLSAREKEEFEINQKYSALIADATKYGQDTTTFEAARLAELAKMRDKFNKEDKDKTEKDNKEKKDAAEKSAKELLEAESTAAKLKYEQGATTEEEYQIALYEIKNKYAQSDKERQQAEIDLLDFANKKKQEAVDATEKANKAVAQSYLDLASNLGSTFTTIAGLFEKGSDAAKTFAVIGVLLNAASAIGKIRLATLEATADFAKAAAAGASAIATGTAMLPLNPITGAALIASGTTASTAAAAGIAAAKTASAVQMITVGVTSAAQIAAILSAGKSSSVANATGASSGGGQAATPAFNGTVSVPAPQISASQASSSGNLGQIVGSALQENNSKTRPIQAYVIGDQVSTQQQLDRRISVAAKMGG